MIRVTGRPVFHKTSVDDVADLLCPHDLILIDRDSHYVVHSFGAFSSVPFFEVQKGAKVLGGAFANTQSDTTEASMHTPRECARLLATLFLEQEKAEGSGNYRISRDDIVRITGRPIIHQTIIEDIADWLVDLGLILVDRDSFFVVLQHDYFDEVRWAPESVLNDYAQDVTFGEPGLALK
tara:strand:+ start:23755 stop:24294 length:540 start_codon:yes stop_codon:yes gene_type:complete